MSQYTNDLHSLSHTKWNCKYHVVFAPKYRRKAFYDARRLEVGNQLEQKHGKYEKISNSLARLTSTDGTIFYLFETVEDSKQGVKLVDETNKNEVFLMKTGNSYVVTEEK